MEMAKKIKCGAETVSIRAYNPDQDLHKVLGLWESAFNKEMPLALWKWKYLENPYETAILICENEQGKPVVLYGGVPFSSNFFGRTGAMIHLSDIMSHPDYRGSGLFIHTANTYFEVFGEKKSTWLMYGFPGKYHFDIGAKYLAYSPIGEGAAYFLKDCDALKKNNTLFSGQIRQFTKSDPCMDDLWHACEKHYPLSVIRDAAFMKWRFFDHPQHTYTVWGCFPDALHPGHCQAMMVVRIVDHKAVIVDMLAPESDTLVCGFVGKVAQMLSQKGIRQMAVWFPVAHFLSRIFIAAGFDRKKEPIGIIPTIRIFEESLVYEKACETIYYTMADGDLF